MGGRGEVGACPVSTQGAILTEGRGLLLFGASPWAPVASAPSPPNKGSASPSQVAGTALPWGRLWMAPKGLVSPALAAVVGGLCEASGQNPPPPPASGVHGAPGPAHRRLEERWRPVCLEEGPQGYALRPAVHLWRDARAGGQEQRLSPAAGWCRASPRPRLSLGP